LENIFRLRLEAGGVKEGSNKPTTKKNRKKSPAVDPESIPPGIPAFLGDDNHDLFKRDDTVVVLPEGRPCRRSGCKKQES
jgi:hypothetical protein